MEKVNASRDFDTLVKFDEDPDTGLGTQGWVRGKDLVWIEVEYAKGDRVVLDGKPGVIDCGPSSDREYKVTFDNGGTSGYVKALKLTREATRAAGQRPRASSRASTDSNATLKSEAASIGSLADSLGSASEAAKDEHARAAESAARASPCGDMGAVAEEDSRLPAGAGTREH